MNRSSPDFQIATAHRQDASRIAIAHARLFDEPWNQKSIAGLLDNPATLALITTTAGGNAIAGFVIAHVAADEAEVLSIGVTPELQRHGLGERLLREVGKVAAARGARRVYVDVAKDNAAALALYSRLGFAVTGRRKGYYARQNAPPSDALLLAWAL